MPFLADDPFGTGVLARAGRASDLARRMDRFGLIRCMPRRRRWCYLTRRELSTKDDTECIIRSS
jgi:hypothetical protein